MIKSGLEPIQTYHIPFNDDTIEVLVLNDTGLSKQFNGKMVGICAATRPRGSQPEVGDSMCWQTDQAPDLEGRCQAILTRIKEKLNEQST